MSGWGQGTPGYQYPLQTGFPQQNQGFPQQQQPQQQQFFGGGLQPQPTGFPPRPPTAPGSFQQPQQTGFGLQPQPTGFPGSSFQQRPPPPPVPPLPSQFSAGGQPSFLSQPPPPVPNRFGPSPGLVAQPTGGFGLQAQPTGFPGAGPLIPQQTGFLDPRLQMMSSTFLPANTSTPYNAAGAPQLQSLGAGFNLQQSFQQHNREVKGTAAPRVPWALSKSEKKSYDQIFRAWDSASTGFIDGQTAIQVFGQSGLGKDDLAKIWALADADNRGKLNIAEFHVAMGLIYRKLNGNEIPDKLPAELVPPSHRDLDEAVHFVRDLVKNDTRSSSPADGPQSRLKVRSFDQRDAPGAGSRQDATVYRHDESAAPLGGRYVPRSRHVDRDEVRGNNEARGAAEDLDDLKRQLARTADRLDEAAAESAGRTREDEELERELDDLRFRAKRLREDLDYLTRAPRNAANDEERRRLERQLLALMHERLPDVERRIKEREARKEREKRELARERDRRNDTFGRYRDRTDDPYERRAYERERERDRDRYDDRDRFDDRERRPYSRGGGGDYDDRDRRPYSRGADDRDRPYSRAGDDRDRRDDRDRLDDRDRDRDRGYDRPPARTPPPPVPAAAPAGSLAKPPPPVPAASPAPALKSMTPAERQAYLREQAALKVRQRMEALGVAPSPSSTPKVDTSVEDRLVQERKEAEDKAREAERAAEERERARAARLENEKAAREGRAPAPTPPAPKAAPTPPAPAVPKAAPRPPPPAVPGKKAPAPPPPRGVLKNAPKPPAPAPAPTPPAPPAVDPEEERLREREEQLRRQREERAARLRQLEMEEEEERRREEAIIGRRREAEEKRRREEEEERRRAEEERKRVEEDARKRAEDDARKRAEEDARKRAEEARTAAAAAPPPPPPPAPPAPAPGGSSTNPFNRLNGAASAAATPPAALNTGGSNPFFRPPSSTPTPAAPKSPAPVTSAPKGSYNTAPGAGDSEDDWGVEKEDDDDTSDDEFTGNRNARERVAAQLFGSILPARPQSAGPPGAGSGTGTPTSASAFSAPPPPPPPPSAPPAPIPSAVPAAPPPPPPPSAVSPAAPSGGGDRGALLSAIQGGARLRKAVTNDRSTAGVSGRVLGDTAPPPHINAQAAVEREPVAAPPSFLPPADVPPPPMSVPMVADDSRTSNRQSVDWYAGLAADAGGGTGPVSREPSGLPPPSEEAEEPESEAVPAIHVFDSASGASAGEPDAMEDVDKSVTKRVRTLYAYEGQRAEDLSVGENVVLTAHPSKSGGDWWYGTTVRDGKAGFFPKAYVQEFEIVKAKALYAYEGTSADELPFAEGDVLDIIDRAEADWWKAEHGGVVFIVPAAYLEVQG